MQQFWISSTTWQLLIWSVILSCCPFLVRFYLSNECGDGSTLVLQQFCFILQLTVFGICQGSALFPFLFSIDMKLLRKCMYLKGIFKSVWRKFGDDWNQVRYSLIQIWNTGKWKIHWFLMEASFWILDEVELPLKDQLDSLNPETSLCAEMQVALVVKSVLYSLTLVYQPCVGKADLASVLYFVATSHEDVSVDRLDVTSPSLTLLPEWWSEPIQLLKPTLKTQLLAYW